MIRNYVKTALRYLLKYKGYTAISVAGLAVGVTCCILIMLFIKSEFSYDRFHSQSARIFRAWQHERYDGQDFINVVTPIPMGPAMQASIPGIEASCRVNSFNTLVRRTAQSFAENINMVDPSFFRIFDFPLAEGSRTSPFPSIQSVILTRQTAVKYFGSEPALGKVLLIRLGESELPFTVSGIAENPPRESSIRFDMLISGENAKAMFRPAMFHSWTNVFNETYVLLAPGITRQHVEAKFPEMVRRALGEDYKEGSFRVFLQPLTDIHLNTSLPAGNLPISDPKYSYILGTIGILVLVLACVNFITLSVGQSVTRSMEVGVRKVLGAGRRQLIRQFWGEAILISLFSFASGILAANLMLSAFNTLVGRNLVMSFDLTTVLFSLALVGLMGLLAGIYPAIVLSGFRPAEVLKGKFHPGQKPGTFRRALVIGQFAVAIAMIACTLVVREQLNFLRTSDLGYNKEQLVVIPTHMRMVPGFELAKLFGNELRKYPAVTDVTSSAFSLAETPWATLGYTDDVNVYRKFSFNVVEPNFLPALGIKMVQGRNFDASNPADRPGSIVVNESLCREYGWKNAIGRKLPGPYPARIIGVVHDFNFESLHTGIRPLVLALQPDSMLRHSQDIAFGNPPEPRISVRLRPGNLSRHIDLLRRAWSQTAPGQEFEFRFLDDVINAQYSQEQRADSLIRLASALSIFIACMGLFGLATLAVSRRTKEIGIRKVLGAGVAGIVYMLSGSFVGMIAWASLIALPVAWWLANLWLKDFAYQARISGWVYLTAPVVAILLALATISVRAVRAAMANPVNSLRTE